MLSVFNIASGATRKAQFPMVFRSCFAQATFSKRSFQPILVVQASLVPYQQHRARHRAAAIRHRCDSGSVRHLAAARRTPQLRSEEHTSELQTLMPISYAVFCLKKHKTEQIK